jgi:MFS transporter, DHA2 family, multidrug resistance protein
MTAHEPPRAASRLAVNHWFVAFAVTVPTFMEVLDTSIASVSLRYIAGDLSAAETESEWIATSYFAANAIILPISGWLSTRFGRRRYFVLSLAGFTAMSLLCGIATNLQSLIIFRALQGIAGGGLYPCTQAVLLDSFPREKQGGAMAMFTVATLVAPIAGPTVGGWITDSFSWRWLFLINVPIGLAALPLCAAVLHDPPHLVAQRAAFRRKAPPFDFVGLGLVTVGLASLEVLLSKGQEWDWLGDPFGRVHWLVAGVVVGLSLAVWWELRVDGPMVDLRPLADRNFAASSIICFCAAGIMCACSTALPLLLQNLLGYDAIQAGLMMSTAGVFSTLALPIVIVLLGRGLDARWLIAAGAVILAAGQFWTSRMNLFMGPGHVAWSRSLLGIAVTLIFTPLNIAAFASLPPHLRGAATGLLALLRNDGGGVGVSIARSLRDRREQFHLERLGDCLNPFSPNLDVALGDLRTTFVGFIGDPVRADTMAWQSVSNLRAQQALSMGYLDCFRACAVLSLALIPLVLLMKRSVAGQGAHLFAE